MDWALEQARAKTVVVSGFHSPLEESVLKVLMAARSPVVAVLARPLEGAKLPPEWAQPMAQGHMAVVCMATRLKRLTQDAATTRNDHAAQLASGIVVAYASASGTLADLCSQWQTEGRDVNRLEVLK